MKILKFFAVLLVLFVMGACSVSSSISGDANSKEGQAFIASIKGRLYGDSLFTKPIPVADNGDVFLSEDNLTVFFVNAVGTNAAYYYMPERIITNDVGDVTVVIPLKTLFVAFIIQGNTVYNVEQVKSFETIAEDLGLDPATEAPEDLKKIFAVLYTKENYNMSKATDKIMAYLKR